MSGIFYAVKHEEVPTRETPQDQDAADTKIKSAELVDADDDVWRAPALAFGCLKRASICFLLRQVRGDADYLYWRVARSLARGSCSSGGKLIRQKC